MALELKKPILDSIEIDGTKFYNSTHLKGYAFDSLVYRYIRAREQMAEYEYIKDSSKKHDKAYYQLQANRDIMRFCQILDEIIGDHD